MTGSWDVWVRAHRIRVGLAVIGAALAALVPFFYNSGMLPWDTKHGAELGDVIYAFIVRAIVGGIGGWALGALFESGRRTAP